MKQMNIPITSVSEERFKELAAKGLNCKQIAKEMGCKPYCFGLKMKEILGTYPSIYIWRMKNGKTKNCFLKSRRND